MGRVEETNAALTELEKTMVKTLDDTTSKEIAVAVTITGVSSVNEEIAKSLAQLADDIHCLREKISKWLEEDEEEPKPSKLTCADCKYSDVLDHIDTGFLTRLNVEFCHRRDAEVDFRFTPICKHFEQKEEEAES